MFASFFSYSRNEKISEPFLSIILIIIALDGKNITIAKILSSCLIFSNNINRINQTTITT